MRDHPGDEFVPDVPGDELQMLDRYLADDMTAAEQASADAWIRGHPDRLAHAKVLRSEIDRAFELEPTTRAQRHARAHAARTMDDAVQLYGMTRQTTQGGQFSHGRFRLSRSWEYVVPVGVVATLAIGLFITGTVPKTGQFPADVPEYVHATGSGEMRTLTLSDGSRVVMAPESRLVVAHDFGARTRTVTLMGEAYFTVPQRSTVPFVVRTDRIVTQVVGTEFNVRRYPADVSVEVAVTSGRVVTRGAGKAVTIGAGMIAQVTDSTATATNGDVRASSEWRTGRLVFDDTPVATVLASVGRWYGYEFVIPDSALARRRIMADFHTNARERTLSAIKHLLNVTMTFDGSTVTVRARQLRGTTPVRRDTMMGTKPGEVGK
jgi:transmembrane sensor